MKLPVSTIHNLRKQLRRRCLRQTKHTCD
jgi:hypothetical protein